MARQSERTLAMQNEIVEGQISLEKSQPPATMRTDGKLAWKITLIGLMYLCQAIPMGFIFGSAPAILRSEHAPLKYIGMLFILHLPWATKLFYASLVDKHFVPAFGRRKTWIAPAQFIASLLFYWMASFRFSENYFTVFLLLLAYAVVMATSDIAVDGYATDILGLQNVDWGPRCKRAAGLSA